MEEKTIVSIPAYNEGETIFYVVNSIKTHYPDYEVLVVDDGSDDDTSKQAKEAGAIVYQHHKNFGLARTFNTEMEQALKLGADIIVHLNADWQYDIEDIPKLLEEIEKGADLVLGWRVPKDKKDMPLIKRFGNRCFTILTSWITGMKIYDSQTGFRAMTKEVAKIQITSNLTYVQELIIKAVAKNFKVTQVPVSFYKREKGKSRLMKTPWSYAFKGGIGVIGIMRDYKPLIFFGSISLFFFGIGMFIGLYLIYKAWIGSITNKVGLIILCALFMLIAINGAFFTLLADKEKF